MLVSERRVEAKPMVLQVACLPKLIGPGQSQTLQSTTVVLIHHRTTATVTTMLGEGASSVRMFGRIQALLKAAEDYNRGDVILGGETNLGKIPSFERANSPREYATGDVRDKTVLLKTTNGSVAS